MYSFAPSQLFALRQHQQQQLRRAMFTQQQQGANLLFHQYNQLRSMQAGFANSTLTPVAFAQQSLDQLVPQTQPQISATIQQQQLQQQLQQQFQQQLQQQLQQQMQPQIPSPVPPQLQQQLQQQFQQQMQPPIPSPVPPQLQQQFQQQMQRSSPINMISIPSPDAWLAGSPIPQSSNLFHPISHTMLDIASYNSRPNSISSDPSSPLMSGSYDSPKLTHRYYSKPQSSPENHRRRERLHSGSSCYESDSSDSSNDDDDQFEWRLTNSKTKQTRKQSNSMGRSELGSNEKISNDIYQNFHNNSELFPAINSVYHSSTKNNNNASRPKLIQYIDENIIGKNHIFNGPWGLRRKIYCDYTATGQSLKFIENYIRFNVLPLYGNTHSETSLCAQQSTRFREEARNLIKKSVNANEKDVLLFVGSGSTGAVHQLVAHLDLGDERIRNNTVVMVSAFEHHSNILPWQETGVEMIRLSTTQQGTFDKSYLKEKLQQYSKLQKRIICSLNAASNITGIYTDVDSISTLVHSYSGLIFWDYATAAPYAKIDMNPSSTAYKDAIFISTHKFLGGPGTPGILIAKKNLFDLRAPKLCGGGTVNFVTRTRREYNYNTEIREEGGTPDIISCIRAGLVFQLKDSLDLNYIKTREEELVKRFFRRFKNHEQLIILGSQTAPRLPIFSFTIYIPGVCKYLHHNLVCRLFNDLFGIQVRSGCACAGPYALDLLNVNDAKTDIYCMFMTEDVCMRGNEKITRTMMMKPGFTRLNLPFFVTDDEIEYILNAVDFVATHGWKFLPLYTYTPATASWTTRSGFQLAQSSLESITYKSGKMQFHGKRNDLSLTRGEKNLPDPFREAKLLAADAIKHALETIDFTSDPPLNVPDKYKHMVWFSLPIDIALMLLKEKESGQKSSCDVNSIPFIPDDAKARIINSMKTKSVAKGRSASTSILQKKINSNRSLSKVRVQ